MKVTPETVVLVNCDCAEIQKIARAVRDRNIYTMVMPGGTPIERVLAEDPVGLVLIAGEDPAKTAEYRAKFAAVKLPQFSAVQVEDADAIVDFCVNDCKCTKSWKLENFIDEAVADIRAQVGDQTVVLGLSGGVDSSVTAALIHRAIGDRLTCVFVNSDFTLWQPSAVRRSRTSFSRTLKSLARYLSAKANFLALTSNSSGRDIQVYRASSSSKSVYFCPRLRIL